MFGYVRPFMDKLTEEDRERFQSVYCGLCYELGSRYGVFSRFILNYDFTFLAMLLSNEETECVDFHCPCKWFHRHQRRDSCAALEIAADMSVILSYWKIEDEIQDSGFMRRLGFQVLRWIAAPSYYKAAKKHPNFAAVVKINLKALRRLEEERSASIDRTADAFASLLAAAAEAFDTEEKRRIHRQLLYHLGRWIYLIDALDDLQKDVQENKYNPLIYRYGLENGMLNEENQQKLVTTLDHSVNLVSSAFALGSYGPWTGVLENIIYYGLPMTGRLVLEGKWKAAEHGGICFKAGHGIVQRERMETHT